MTSILEAILRILLGPRKTAFLRWCGRRFGVVGATWATLCLFARRPCVALPLGEYNSVVWVRPLTTDRLVFDQVFQDQQYAVDLDDPALIIDAGANVGFASIFLAHRYPNARIIALEPEQHNVELLQRNVRGYDNIHPIRAGLWSRSTRLVITNPDSGSWAFQVTESKDGVGIPALGVKTILQQANADRVDMLKMDVEGAEREILSTSAEWKHQVDMLVIETHDTLVPGCSDALDRAVRGHATQRTTKGENTVVRLRTDAGVEQSQHGAR